MLKVTYTNVTRSDIMEICNITGAHIADLSPKSMVIELTAKTSKIDRFIKLMQPLASLRWHVQVHWPCREIPTNRQVL